MPQTIKRRHSAHGIGQVANVVSSLIALQNGTAKSKRDAAAQNGTTPAALTPRSLARLGASHPVIANISRCNPLEITAEINGEGTSKRRVSMREALSQGAERCVAIMAELAPKIGHMTKEEERSYGQAARWLQMCRTIGLFGENEGAAVPRELQHEPEARTDTPEHWQEARQMDRIGKRMITVIPDPEPETLDAEEQDDSAQR